MRAPKRNHHLIYKCKKRRRMLIFFRVPRISFPSQTNHYLIFLGISVLLLKSGTSQSNSVSQKQDNIEVVEGEDAALLCDFKTLSSTPYLYWYHQYKLQGLEQILTAHGYGNNLFQEGKFGFWKSEFSSSKHWKCLSTGWSCLFLCSEPHSES